MRYVTGTSGCENGTSGSVYTYEKGLPSELIKGKYGANVMLLQPKTREVMRRVKASRTS